jgi:hypothetical protein
MEGGCHCGAVRYSLAVERLKAVYCCHCRECQTMSGSAFAEQALVGEAQLSVSGPLADYSYTNRSGFISRQFFCGTCRVRIYNTNGARPGLAVIRAGTLDASDMLEPRAHIWVKRKQPWIALPEGIPAFEESGPPAELAAILLAG